MELQPLKEMAAFAALPRPALPPGGKALPHVGGEPLKTAAEEEEKLRCAEFGLREPPRPVVVRQRPRMAPQLGQPLAQAADARLYVQGEQVVVLVAEAPPAH